MLLTLGSRANKPILVSKMPVTVLPRKIGSFEKMMIRKVVELGHGVSWSSLRSLNGTARWVDISVTWREEGRWVGISANQG